MSVFEDYSCYYDLLYSDKDYEGESAFIEGLIRSHHPSALTVLELGCGTGKHAELLVRSGFQVHGVDCSERMLAEACARRRLLTGNLQESLKFSPGDMRYVRLGNRFDTVISLFHVMSYQTDNNDLEAAFATATAHLMPGGLFFFDFWYGPAVLSQRPEVRVKRMKGEGIEVTRIAEPDLNTRDNCVTVNYEINIVSTADGRLQRLQESHPMRYLFIPEIEGLLGRHGLQPLFFQEWMTGNLPGADTWSVCAGARLKG